jgi:mRNA interferase MazF
MSAAFRKWDVVLLAYPFTDLSASKVRPAVVVSPDSENGILDDSVFLLITSNTSRLSPFDLLIDTSHPEFANTGLSRSSAVRVNKVWTLKNTLVRRVLGSLGSQLRRGVLRRLATYFEIPA